MSTIGTTVNYLTVSWLAHTDPRDVARVEGKTFICTATRREAVPQPAPGVQQQQLGNWMSLEDLDVAIGLRFPGCMKGRTMYLLPYRFAIQNRQIIGKPKANVIEIPRKIVKRFSRKFIHFVK